MIRVVFYLVMLRDFEPVFKLAAVSGFRGGCAEVRGGRVGQSQCLPGLFDSLPVAPAALQYPSQKDVCTGCVLSNRGRMLPRPCMTT